jgi:hypothetical protein
MSRSRAHATAFATALVVLVAACGGAATSSAAPVTSAPSAAPAASTSTGPAASGAAPASAAVTATPPPPGTAGNYCFYWHQVTAAPWGDWLADPLHAAPDGSLGIVTFGPTMSTAIISNPAAASVKDAWNTVIYLGYQNQIDPSKPAITPGADYVAAVAKIEAFNATTCP